MHGGRARRESADRMVPYERYQSLVQVVEEEGEEVVAMTVSVSVSVSLSVSLRLLVQVQQMCRKVEDDEAQYAIDTIVQWPNQPVASVGCSCRKWPSERP